MCWKQEVILFFRDVAHFRVYPSRDALARSFRFRLRWRTTSMSFVVCILVLVENEEKMRVWNELFLQEHPQGVGPLVGRQLRYLIGSEHGWLGGGGFASAALQFAARDYWIGWDAETRQAHLHRVVSISRS